MTTNYKNKFGYAIYITVCVFSCAFITISVSAIDRPKGLTISPIRSELELAPGTSLNGKLSITNSTNSTMTVNLEAEKFSVINSQYDYAFTAESNVAKWVSFSSNNLSLNPGQTSGVTYTVSAPLLTEPGGRYISIFASTNTSSGSGILSKQRLASLLYINVTGEVTRLGSLATLSSPWLVTGDTNWSMTIQNKGSTHFRSRYNLKIRDILGGEIGKGFSDESLILPNTVRLLANKIPLPDWPGLYIAEYNIGLGDTPAKQERRLFVYSPVWFTTLLAALITVFVIRFRSKKKPN